MIKAFHHPEKTLLGIQGLCCIIAEKYMADIPETVQNKATLRDRLRKDSLIEQQDKYRRRAGMENESIKMVGHITGRTDFDRLTTEQINPNAVYHHMNETMRSCFYSQEQWKKENCKPYSIFMAQGDYPLKGLHYMLQAMPKLLSRYPTAHLYVAGNSIIGKADRRTVQQVSFVYQNQCIWKVSKISDCTKSSQKTCNRFGKTECRTDEGTVFEMQCFCLSFCG
jgi:hypothetical protein